LGQKDKDTGVITYLEASGSASHAEGYLTKS
jgi:hypothetical protein